MVSENSITAENAEVQAVVVTPGSRFRDFGLYFFVKRPQDPLMDAMKMIP